MISSWRRRKAARRAAKKLDMAENTGLEELTIPSHFLCPISLELMKDPVTLLSGITYDRENIEKWIEAGNYTCPITNIVLRSLEPIPNHTIRKMIQDWCVENRDYGIERIPTPRIPVSSHEVSEILSKIDAAKGRGDREECRELVVKIKHLMKEGDRNKRCILTNGSSEVLSATFNAFSKVSFEENAVLLKEILSVLTTLSPLEEGAKSYMGSDESLRCMVWFLKGGDLSARRNAIWGLKEILSSNQRKVDKLLEIEGALEAIVKLIKEPICPAATKGSLLVIYFVLSSLNEKAIARFVEMGLVGMLIEMLVDCDRSVCEKALAVLDGLCSFQKGREEACDYALTMPVLVKKLLRISDLATEFSVSILWNLGKNEKREEKGVLVEALQVGAFQKLLLLLQVGCSEKTKEKATELLKLLNLHRDKSECIDSLDFKNLKRPF